MTQEQEKFWTRLKSKVEFLLEQLPDDARAKNVVGVTLHINFPEEVGATTLNHRTQYKLSCPGDYRNLSISHVD